MKLTPSFMFLFMPKYLGLMMSSYNKNTSSSHVDSLFQDGKKLPYLTKECLQSVIKNGTLSIYETNTPYILKQSLIASRWGLNLGLFDPGWPALPSGLLCFSFVLFCTRQSVFNKRKKSTAAVGSFLFNIEYIFTQSF